MITFNDINISDDKNTVYIPRRLRDCFCDFLKNRRPDIQYDTISRKGRVGCCRIYPCRGKRQTDPYKKFVENFTFL